MIKNLFSRKWIFATLLVIAAMAVMVRLGKWQLDRLNQRRAFNAHITEMDNSLPVELAGADLAIDLTRMEYRQVSVRGEYDFENEIAIRNQAWNSEIGVHLLTPLKIAGSDQAVLVDRGWIPLEDFQTGNWGQFAEPGEVTVSGMIRVSQEQPTFGGRPDPTPSPGERIDTWNYVTIESIAQQIPYPLLNIYIQQAPDPAWTDLPYRFQPDIEITEGPHMGYAIQWFTFAAILGIGYPVFVDREEKKAKH